MTNTVSKKDKDSLGATDIISGAPEGHDARILAERARTIMPADKVLVHVALDDTRLATLRELLAFFAPDVAVVEFPAWDCLPYDRVSPNPEIVARRVAALCELLRWDEEAKRYPRIVLTTVNAASQRLMPRDILSEASFSKAVGDRVSVGELESFFAANGYSRSDTVREAGEYALRGGIVDVFPPGFDNPVRLDLFGDEIESIREFDAMSQTSLGKLNDFTLRPVSECFLDEGAIARFRSGYREHFGVVQADDPLYDAVSEGRKISGMEHWLPLFYEGMDTLFDYVPAREITLDHQALQAMEERRAQIEDFYQARKTLEDAARQKTKKAADVSLSGAVYHPLPPGALYMDGAELEQGAELSPFAANDDDARKGRDFADIRALPDGDVFAELKAHLKTLPEKTIIACYSEGSLERMKGLFAHAGIDTGRLELAVLHLEHGFVAPGLAVITEQDILGDRLTRKSTRKRKADNFLREVSALSEGDLVVHIDHGIGKFVKLETVKVGKTRHDCLQIEYAGGDRLYVPVENIEVLSRFGGEDATVQLDKLGGAGWQARKAKVKKDLMEMADHLLGIAAARALRKTDAFTLEPGLYNEFAARFPYSETEDQERAILDTIADIGKDTPMDRLVCGDVGFGKTEVAMRAAYVAAMNGAQVAVVVPTTLLARQHYQNFKARFSGTGLRVEQLSRLVSAKDAATVKDGLRDGSVNIIIGTHALFAKDVKFAHLGLIVIDEEQRFGVKQKERLKELKNDVHVLTLSATPIPRTLQMSLTGVKELSLITTPPVDRLAVRTFILPFDPVVIRESLLREHYRGGQSFYVCPRIKDMDALEKELKELVPEIKIITAHGQMAPTDLEDRMTAFTDKQYDVLLATNIIESGIDIPSANTMVIHRADLFGLAQLYQIRGRIGRSKLRAYAYLTYPPHIKMNPGALKRLEVMETLDTLGSGFQLASHDMDMRGAGNLLGEQQSGHIKEVGAELYQQMLEEAVAAAREGTDYEQVEDTQWSPQINVGTSVLIPETYVEDLGVRMSLYRRLSDLVTPEDLEAFAAELIDRFGPIPEEVNNLLDIVTIKQMCKQAGVSHVEAGPKGAVIGFHNNSPPNVEGLLGWIAGKGGVIKLRPDQKLVAIRAWDTADQRVKGVKSLMKELTVL